MTLASPTAFAVALILVIATALVLWARRPALPRATIALGGVALLLLTAAAGEPVWRRPAPVVVDVMVDFSPSTRGAGFRDSAWLRRRIEQLIGIKPYRLRVFAAGMPEIQHNADEPRELPAERTVFTPPAGDVVLLFSDARFELPAAAPRTYVVVDPALEDVSDASVVNLERRAEQVAVTTRNSSSPRPLRLTALATQPAERVAPPGDVVQMVSVGSGSALAAKLSGGDAWPENDALTIGPAPPERDERWWVGVGDEEPEGFRSFTAADLPTDAASYLATSVIVLHNLPASAFGTTREQRLEQYVRDLGGALVLVGGDRSFAAGGYAGSTLDSLSPLSSSPPEPTTHWILLADASGSMADDAGAGVSRWKFATDAVLGMIPKLPPADVLSVGSFAEDLRWWSQGHSARETAALPLPPTGVAPHGPTNLRAALQRVAGEAEASLAKQLLVLTDANVELGDVASLAAALRQKNIRLHVLAIGGGTGLAALQTVAAQTGGSVLAQSDAGKWAESVRQLMQAATPDRLRRDRVRVTFSEPFKNLAPEEVSLWNRTWLKQTATEVARTEVADRTFPMTGMWNRGEGLVLALPFPARPELVRTVADRIARPAHDPRYRVTWDSGPARHVSVEASDASSGYLNGEQLELVLSGPNLGGSIASVAIPQTGPGRYEATVPGPRTPIIAAVRTKNSTVSRVSLAGRYAREFESLGNDHDAMRELARRTGGQVIPPSQTTPIDFRWPTRDAALASPLAAAAAALLAIGLIVWARL